MGIKVGLRNTVENFKINVCDKLSNIEASKNEIDESLNDIHNKLVSSSETLNNSWKDSNSSSTKNTVLLLDNVVLRLCQSVENDLGGVIETITKINELIERINSNYQQMQNLNFGEYTSYIDTDGTTKRRYQANDQAQIDEYNNENTNLNNEIEKIIKCLTNAVNAIDLKIEYDDNGIVTNVADEYDKVNLLNIIQIYNSAMEITAESTPEDSADDESDKQANIQTIIFCGMEYSYNPSDKESISKVFNELQAKMNGYSSYISENSEEKINTWAGKQVIEDGIAYHNYLNNAYLHGFITKEEYENYMKSLTNHSLTDGGLYDVVLSNNSGNFISNREIANFGIYGSRICGWDDMLYSDVETLYESILPDSILTPTTTIDERLSIINNSSLTTNERTDAIVSTALEIQRGVLDGTYTYSEASALLEKIQIDNNQFSGEIGKIISTTKYWLDDVEAFDTIATELGLQTYSGSLT